jgi:hypothetical protein
MVLEKTCTRCHETKDELLFHYSSRLKRAGRRSSICKSCFNRQLVKQKRERKDAIRDGQNARNAMYRTVNKAIPFLTLENKYVLAEYLLAKKWTIETVLRLHKVPTPIVWRLLAEASKKKEGTMSNEETAM